ncbi:MAG: D-sedoheptulose 7-phosphate isomerase [Blastocatellia bacterium]|jgi:D-sedoheptulose 7-phosphate isomerase|nr:D-sedoheptulose 7-phosphate isomerase [Blastocatellia bacterium]
MTKAAEDFSRAFYPFLHGNEKEPQALMDELRFSLLEKARESVDVKSRFFQENKDTILQASLAIAKAFHHGHKLLVCGNGGSATDAQHVAVEFMHPITVGRKALPAICLSNDMAMVTGVANDVGFDDVFVRQIIALGRESDVLLGISTSGNSVNLLQAFAMAQRMGLLTIGFAGNDGGRMEEMRNEGLLDFCLSVPTSSIHRIQETHVTLYHIMWDMTHTFLEHRGMLEERALTAV